MLFFFFLSFYLFLLFPGLSIHLTTGKLHNIGNYILKGTDHISIEYTTMPDYICQRCKLPLTLDKSLEDISDAQRRLLTTNYTQRPKSVLNNITEGAKYAGVDWHDSEGNESEFLDTNSVFIPEERRALLNEALANSNGKPLINRQAGIDSSTEDDGSFVVLKEERDAKNEDTGISERTKESEATTLSSKSKAHKMDKQSIEDQQTIEDQHAISDRVNTFTNMFNIISSKYELDYPVCSDCANAMIKEMENKLNQLTEEKNMYVEFLRKLQRQNGPNNEESAEDLKKYEKLEKEEQSLLQQIKEAEEKGKQLKKELTDAEVELGEVEKKENECYLRRNEYEMKLRSSMDDLGRAKSMYQSNMDQLDTLRKANVFTDTFDITFDGPVGRINELRLGIADDKSISWNEINAALGHIVLLLSVCIRILNISIPEYILVPMGSTSRIERIEKDKNDPDKKLKKVFDLYSVGEFSLGRIFTHNKLDAGMMALLDVIRRIADELKKISPENELPFRMSKNKIGGHSICPSARQSNEDWTEACKYLLTNVKWILTLSMGHYQSV